MEEIKDYTYKIRPLTIKDRKVLSRLIKKLTENADYSYLLKVISSSVIEESSESEIDSGVEKVSEPKESKMIKAGIKILTSLIDTLENETQAWFADLINVPVEEFENLPIDTELKIIDQIINASEADTFFTLACQLYSKIGKLKSRLSGQKID